MSWGPTASMIRDVDPDEARIVGLNRTVVGCPQQQDFNSKHLETLITTLNTAIETLTLQCEREYYLFWFRAFPTANGRGCR